MTSPWITTATAGTALAALALAPLALTTPAQAVGDTATERQRAGTTQVVRTERQLRRAVLRANRRDGQDRIQLASNIRLARAGDGGARLGDLDISDDLEILGKGHVINGLRNDRILDVRPGTRLLLRGATLRKGRARDGANGGAIRNLGTTVVRASTLESNAAVSGTTASGGAIVNEGGTLRVQRTVVDGNTARRAGGGIEATPGSRTVIRNSTLVDNATGAMPGNGGAFHLTGAGSTTVRGSFVAFNTASAEGGGLWNSAVGQMRVVDTSFVGNVASGAEADQGGGALYNDGGELTVETSRVRANSADGASGSGGGLLNVNGGSVTVTEVQFVNNDAARAGGAIETNGGALTIGATTARGNSTGAKPGNGGALHITGAGTVTWDGGVVRDNVAAAEGGGLWNSATGTLTVTGVTIEDNQAPVNPDNHNDGGVFTIDGEPVPPTP